MMLIRFSFRFILWIIDVLLLFDDSISLEVLLLLDVLYLLARSNGAPGAHRSGRGGSARRAVPSGRTLTLKFSGLWGWGVRHPTSQEFTLSRAEVVCRRPWGSKTGMISSNPIMPADRLTLWLVCGWGFERGSDEGKWYPIHSYQNYKGFGIAFDKYGVSERWLTLTQRWLPHMVDRFVVLWAGLFGILIRMSMEDEDEGLLGFLDDSSSIGDTSNNSDTRKVGQKTLI